MIRFHFWLKNALLLVGVSLFAPMAWGHALLLSTQAVQQDIVGRAFYSDDTAAQDEAVEVFLLPKQTEPTASVQTDDQGRFRFVDLVPGVYQVVVYGIEGHRAQATVELSAQSAQAPTSAATTEEIALLRQDIARLHARIRLSDIVGGIGYIVGLAGAYLLFIRRRHE